MKRKLVLPVLALACLGFAAMTVAAGYREVPVPQEVTEPAASPFAEHISGSGIVEASSRNISIGSPVGRIVLAVPPATGAAMKAGDVLFRLDDRDLKADLGAQRAAAAAARARLDRLEAMPRVEERPALEARVAAAKAQHEDAVRSLTMARSVTDPRAISEEDLSRRRYAAETALARLEEAKAQLDLHTAGAWKEDVAVARAELASAQAQVAALEAEIDRMVVRAPMDGRVLQVNIRPGEYAKTDAAHIVFGAVDALHVRVDVDENDAWRFRAGAAARASLRGRPDMQVTLRFEYVEPYVVPKRMLNGSAVERVDTRVLQVVYSFAPGDIPIYVGQQLDVLVEVAQEARS